MIQLLATEKYKKLYHDLQPEIKKKLWKQEMIFSGNPHHPSLNTEKIAPKQKEIWTFRVDKKYRVVFRFEDHETVVLLAVGPHDWIYRLRW